MAVTSNLEAMIYRLEAKVAAAKDGSDAMRTALTRIAILFQTQAKLNLRRLGIIDRGGLLNSIDYKIFPTGIEIGSYGIPYAAINEYGGAFTDRQRRAMFANMKRRGGPPRQSKFVIRGNQWRARPYLRPAIAQQTPTALEILREALTP